MSNTLRLFCLFSSRKGVAPTFWSRSMRQVMSTIFKHLTAGLPQLNLDGKSKTPMVAFGKSEQEHVIVFREGELLQVRAPFSCWTFPGAGRVRAFADILPIIGVLV